MKKKDNQKVIALLTAAGVGSRTNQDIPKQFFHIDNKPLIIYTMEAFQKHPNVDEILVVCLDGWHEILKAYAKQFNITKLKYVVSGGATGQESIYNGLKELEKHCDKDDVVIVHDGNRALVSNEIISGALSTFYQYGSAVVAIPTTEVVFVSEDKIKSTEEISRDKLVRTQTPHIYTLGKLLWAHDEAKKRNLPSTAASCSLMKELGETTYFSKGSEKNLKITTLEDLEIFKAILNSEKESWIKN
jgi:2-C-methyl-D-erythritol 4-phosphate cytidylyltransferase